MAPFRFVRPWYSAAGRRVLLFVLFFTVTQLVAFSLPQVVVTLTSHGKSSAMRPFLATLLEEYPAFCGRIILHALAVSMVIATVLALASLWAWSDDDGHGAW